MEQGRAFELLLAKIGESAGATPNSESGLLSECARALNAAVLDAAATTRQLLSERDAALMLANASVYLEMLGHVVVAWIWLRQAVLAERSLATAQGNDKTFYQGKLQACQYFFRYELPRTTAQHELLRRLDATCLEMRDEWF